MKKRLLLSSLFIKSALIASFVIMTPAKAQDTGVATETADLSSYSETFENGKPAGWEFAPDVAIANGVLQISPGNFALKSGKWEDPTISVNIKYIQPGEINVNYNFADDKSYVVHVTSNMARLERIEKGQPTELGSSQLSNMQSGSWLTLGISLSSGLHKISINDTEVITATEENPLSGGGILLSVMGENIGTFDNISIKGKADEPSMQEPATDEGVAAETETKPVIPTFDNAESESTTDVTTEGLQGYISQFFYDKRSDTAMSTFVINLLLATLFAYMLGKVYIHWGTSLSNRRRFAANFIILTVTTTFIIMVVRSSVALSLGLVGALSIVRFRAAVKEPEELAYLFLAIGIGIGLGDNQRLLTLLALAVTIVIIGLARAFRKPHSDANLHLTVASHGGHKVGLEQIVDVLKNHCSKFRLLRDDETHNSIETSFMLEFRKLDNLHDVKADLKKLSPALEITFMDNKGIW